MAHSPDNGTPGNQVTLTSDHFATSTSTSTSTDTDDTTALPDTVDSPTRSQQQALADRSREYAQEVLDDIDSVELAAEDITWTVSTNSQRTHRAGDARAKPASDGSMEHLTVTLTWQAYVAWGWGENWKNLIRHELCHIVQFVRRGEADHGRNFKLLASLFEAPRHCPTFADKRLTIRCGKGCEDGRDQASKVVKQPNDYLCQEHGEEFEAEHDATGRTWETREGYKEQRAAIEAADGVEW